MVQHATQSRKSGLSLMRNFRAISSAAKPRTSDNHTWSQPPLILLVLSHHSDATTKAVNYQFTEKKKRPGNRTHDSRADDPRHGGQNTKKTVWNSLSGASFFFF